MASVRETRTGKFELTIRSKLLPKPLYFTFPTREEADTYGAQCDKWLAAGIVPGELREQADSKAVQAPALLGPVLRAWLNSGEPSASDQVLLSSLFPRVAAFKVAELNYAWAELWVRSMKLEENLAPGTIRKRVQAVSKAIDWHLRKTPDAMVGNPLRLLPRGYSAYNARDAAELAKLRESDEKHADKKPRVDIERDRRLVPSIAGEPSEEQRIVAALSGTKRPDRERPLTLPDGPAMLVLFLLNLWGGLRLREAYTLTVGQVDLAARVIRVRSSKQWHGREKWRTVPIRPELMPHLASYLATRPAAADALLFPFWNGDRAEAELKRTTTRLSQRFATVFDYAGCADLTEHDLRHEATCRWLELRAPGGGWMFRDEEVNKIMGWAPGSLQ